MDQPTLGLLCSGCAACVHTSGARLKILHEAHNSNTMQEESKAKIPTGVRCQARRASSGSVGTIHPAAWRVAGYQRYHHVCRHELAPATSLAKRMMREAQKAAAQGWQAAASPPWNIASLVNEWMQVRYVGPKVRTSRDSNPNSWNRGQTK